MKLKVHLAVTKGESMNEEAKNGTCCDGGNCCSCCDNKTIAKLLRHVADFFSQEK